IEELPSDESEPAEEYLMRLARGRAPEDLPKARDDQSRRRRAESWRRWWQGNEKNVVMPALTQQAGRTLSYPGFVLVIEPDDNRIRERDRNKKVTLNLTGLLEPRDAQWIGDDRLLVAECKGMRVTERDVKGNLLWVLKLDWRPTQAERLPNGDTFIVG